MPDEMILLWNDKEIAASLLAWPMIHYFKPSEFDSPDLPGSGGQMKMALIVKLDRIRHRCGFPFVVASGYRTPAHNAEVGGVDSSSHTEGEAADIVCLGGVQRLKIVAEALKEGITRIGIGNRFVHIDVSAKLPQNVMWTY